MRHVQQLELIEKFKYECKAKGYTQPTTALSMGNHAAHRESHARRKKRTTVIRWIRSHDLNSTLEGISTISVPYDETDSSVDDNFEGFFHEPATVPNDYLEAICGNLTLK